MKTKKGKVLRSTYYKHPIPISITDENGNIVPNRMHQELRDRKLNKSTDFIIPDFDPSTLPIEEEDIRDVLVEAHLSYNDFMDWAMNMLSEWKQLHPQSRISVNMKGALVLTLQKKLIKYIGIDLFGFLYMYINKIDKWPDEQPELEPIISKDKYYVLAIIDGFREKLGIKKYRLMKLLNLQPSDISYFELSYTIRAQRRQDITMYKIFQIIRALHIPPMQFLEHLYRLCREDGNDEEILDHYRCWLSKGSTDIIGV